MRRSSPGGVFVFVFLYPVGSPCESVAASRHQHESKGGRLHTHIPDTHTHTTTHSGGNVPRQRARPPEKLDTARFKGMSVGWLCFRRVCAQICVLLCNKCFILLLTSHAINHLLKISLIITLLSFILPVLVFYYSVKFP